MKRTGPGLIADVSNSELLSYLGKLVDERTKEPKDDLISKLVVEQVKPGNIERADAVQIAFLLLVAGNATMVNMIALVRIALSTSGGHDALLTGIGRA
jgi:nitric oxide reductase